MVLNASSKELQRSGVAATRSQEVSLTWSGARQPSLQLNPCSHEKLLHRRNSFLVHIRSQFLKWSAGSVFPCSHEACFHDYQACFLTSLHRRGPDPPQGNLRPGMIGGSFILPLFTPFTPCKAFHDASGPFHPPPAPTCTAAGLTKPPYLFWQVKYLLMLG